MINLKDLTYEELSELILSLGEKTFRTGQIFSWLYKGVKSFDEMTDLSRTFKEKLAQTAYISVPGVEAKYLSKDGTVKYVWKLADGEPIESVVMEYKHGKSICISTQAGCAMGCKFCASTVGGKSRDLSPGEITDQIIFAMQDLGVRISHVVLMGIGEPLDNYENVVKFLRIAGDERGLNLGYRHISLSTCGLTDRIYDLAKEKMPVTLSVSLHAPEDVLRSSIMPVNRKYNIQGLMEACRAYIRETGRRVSFEYAMIDGVNDTAQCAAQLASLMRGMQCHINLIPVNEARENMTRSSTQNIYKFKDLLEKRNINVTVRRTLGGDIAASCGQLRANSKAGK